MRHHKNILATALLSLLLFSCDRSSPTSTQPESSKSNSSQTVGDLVVTTSYAGADTIPTVAIKSLEALTSQGPVDITIKNTGKTKASVTVSVGIQDYTSSPGEATVTVGAGDSIVVSPQIFIDPAKLATLTTFTQSNYQVKVTSNLTGSTQILLSETHLVNLMARDAMPWYFHGEDLTAFIALFVTPTNPAIQNLLATAKSRTPGNAFIGYQGSKIDSHTVSDSGNLAASTASTFLSFDQPGHGYLSFSYSSSAPVYFEFLDGTNQPLYRSSPAKSMPTSSYTFEAGSWRFINNSDSQDASLAYQMEYFFTSNSVRDQVKAIYEDLKAKGISYSSTTISFPAGSQKVRFPADALKEAAANCIDGTVLMASALEAIGIEPQIVLVPGHAFLGWKESEGSVHSEFLETTMIGTSTFEEALREGAQEFAKYREEGTAVIVDVVKAREVGLLPAARTLNR